jgi:hypothetical protein
MRISLFAPLLVIGGWAAFAVPGHPQEKGPPFSISYAYAGLTSIEVKGGKLHYVWHTPRQDTPLTPQSLEAYDRHKVEVWLTGKEQARFREWITRNKVFDFKKEYPHRPGPGTYGSAFQAGLTVVVGDKKHGAGWDGDSQTPETLGTAINELEALAKEVEKSRRK